MIQVANGQVKVGSKVVVYPDSRIRTECRGTVKFIDGDTVTILDDASGLPYRSFPAHKVFAL